MPTKKTIEDSDEIMILPSSAAQWLRPIGPFLQIPRWYWLSPRQAISLASDRWPLRSISWLSANSQIKGIEYTNTSGRRVQRLWRDLYENE